MIWRLDERFEFGSDGEKCSQTFLNLDLSGRCEYAHLPANNSLGNGDHAVETKRRAHSQSGGSEFRRSWCEKDVRRFKRRRDNAGYKRQHYVVMSTDGIGQAYGWAYLPSRKVVEREWN